ncbi:hypothetical protein FD755_009323, partial [Muntiacus reevesi]
MIQTWFLKVLILKQSRNQPNIENRLMNRGAWKQRRERGGGGGEHDRENRMYGERERESEGVSCHYWSLFDGHAGSGAAVVASRLLQQHVAEQLQDIVEILKNSAVLPPACLGDEPDHAASGGRTLTRAASLRGGVGAPGSPSTPPARFFTEKKIPHECLVIGALESAFKEMDLQIERERSLYNISGGCTALIVVCLLGKLYVANAGDSSGPPVAELGLHGPGPRSLRPVGLEAVLRGSRAQAQWLFRVFRNEFAFLALPVTQVYSVISQKQQPSEFLSDLRECRSITAYGQGELWLTGFMPQQQVGSSKTRIEPASPALTGEFLSTAPPGKLTFLDSKPITHLRLLPFTGDKIMKLCNCFQPRGMQRTVHSFLCLWVSVASCRTLPNC